MPVLKMARLLGEPGRLGLIRERRRSQSIRRIHSRGSELRRSCETKDKMEDDKTTEDAEEEEICVLFAFLGTCEFATVVGESRTNSD